MNVRSRESRQQGSLYVEAALVTPIFLVVLYASIFFCLLTVRQLSIQFAASALAETVTHCISSNSNSNAVTCDFTSNKSSWETKGKQLASQFFLPNPTFIVTACSRIAGTCATSGTYSAGDIFSVQISSDLPKVFGGAVPILGLSETRTIKGGVIGILERGERDRGAL